MANSFEIDGVEFGWVEEQDGDCRAPWDEHDGHGVIREVSLRYNDHPEKHPGEVAIHKNHGTAWLYDVKATTALAKKDGWGLGDEAKAELVERLKREPTKKEITAEAVANDMEFCRKYLNDEICWWSVSCWAADKPDDIKYLGGILDESGAPYIEECAKDLAAQIIYSRKAVEAELDLHMAGL